MASYLVNQNTNRRFEIVAMDRETNIMTLKGETGGIFEEPYDKAKLKDLGYSLVKEPDDESA